MLEDLTGVIERLFPRGSEPSPFERDRALHAKFARDRAKAYGPRVEYFDRLDAHVDGDGKPLVVRGERGADKSALLASWALARMHMGQSRIPDGDEIPAVPLVAHFTAASPSGAEAAPLLKRVIAELFDWIRWTGKTGEDFGDTFSELDAVGLAQRFAASLGVSQASVESYS